MQVTFLILIFLNLCHAKDEFRIINIDDLKGEGSYIPVKSGQKFIIEMEGNPTTGFSWFLEHPEKLNRELIIPLNLNEKNSAEFYRKTSEKENEMKILGSGGIYHFKFQTHPTNSGDEVLHFVYKRPWTNENEIRKSINIKVVNPNSDL
jgi:predicted secreted protein